MIKVLGTPTDEDFQAMNPEYINKKIPRKEKSPLSEYFPKEADPQIVDLIERLLQYNPYKRINLYDAMALPVFNELRENGLQLPNGNCIPDLFDFTEKEK